jgi:hypothetical protein
MNNNEDNITKVPFSIFDLFEEKKKKYKNYIDKFNISTTPLINNENDLAYPDGVYQYIFYTCFLHPVSISAAFYYGNITAGILSIILSSTSFMYWYKPLMNSYRRYIDITSACFVVLYHLYISLYTKKKIICAGLILFGISMYPFSIYLFKLNKIKSAAICHCLIHILCSLGALLTYYDYNSQSNSQSNLQLIF